MNSLYALPVFMKSMPPVAGLVTTSLVASIFVSVSTVALAIASLVVRDFYVPYWKPRRAGAEDDPHLLARHRRRAAGLRVLHP